MGVSLRETIFEMASIKRTEPARILEPLTRYWKIARHGMRGGSNDRNSSRSFDPSWARDNGKSRVKKRMLE